MENQKGITLVALVITIIVLLILAVVTVSMVIGPNGVLSNSKKEKESEAKEKAYNALSTALNSLSTDYNANGEAGDILEKVDKTNLEKLLHEYTITEVNISDSESTTTNNVVMKDKTQNNEYTATITSTLSIQKFEDGNTLSK